VVELVTSPPMLQLGDKEMTEIKKLLAKRSFGAA
jgi:hypothetical protein